MNTPNDQSPHQEKLITEADRLLDSLDAVTACLGQVKRTIDGSTMGDDEFDEAAQNLAKSLQEEQKQLIRAWESLEAEQRQLAIKNAESPAQSSRPQRVGQTERRPSTASTSPAPAMNQVQQFQFLQRECDRKREK